MTEYKKGDKVRYLGGDGDAWNDLTIRKLYEVVTVGDFGEAFILDDTNDYWEISAEEKNARYYELVTEPVEQPEPTPVEASPTVIELLANISRRLYEAEKEIAELNEKQAVFFDIDKLLKNRIFDLERQNRVQAYEINELYREVADRG